MTIGRILMLDKQRSKIKDSIVACEPVLIRAPKYYYKRNYIKELSAEISSKHDFEFRYVDINTFCINGEIDYVSLFEYLMQGVKTRVRLSENNEQDFLEAFYKTYKRFSKKMVYVIPSVRKGFEAYQYQMILLFTKLLDRYAARNIIGFSIIVLDDYKLLYYEGKVTTGVSPIDYYTVHEIRGMGLDEIEELIGASLTKHFKKRVDKVSDIAKNIYDISGGHCGIVYEIIEDLISNKWNHEGNYWDKVVATITKGSQIIENIRIKFLEDIDGLTAKALEFRKAKIVKDLTSPTTQTLRRIGVLKWVSASHAVLCPGIIEKLVVEYDQSASDKESLGTLVSTARTGFYEITKEDYLKESDDFVVVHISDIHIGADYNFRVFGAEVEVEDKRCLLELLKEDLASLDVLSKIDLLVISGDLTCKAEATEFLMAKSFIEGIVNNLEIPKNRIAFVAGNHDFEWKSTSIKTKGFSSNKNLASLHFYTQWLYDDDYSSYKFFDVYNESGSKKLIVIALDTNAVESEDFAGIGRVGMDTLSNIREKISRELKNLDDETELIIWMVFHHHLFPCTSRSLSEVEKKKISVMSNTSELLHFADKMKVELVLHGHEHQPSVTVAQKWPSIKEEGFHKVISIGAGSAGAVKDRLGPFSKNQYYIIYRKSNKLIVRSRQLGPEGLSFMPHDDLCIDL